jgi:galactokinase/mevalonate kinase-like predicted kinase
MDNAAALAQHSQECWTAILNRDLIKAGQAMRASFEAQLKMFPLMADENLRQFIAKNAASAAGYKLSGAGGGGYLILLSEHPVQNALKVRIRRSNWL